MARRTCTLKIRPRMLGGADEVAVGVGRLGEAHDSRLGAVGALVDGHAPAGVVLLGLADHRVLPPRAARAGPRPARRLRTRKPGTWGRKSMARPLTDPCMNQAASGGPARASCARSSGREGAAAATARAPRGRDRVAHGPRREAGRVDDEDAPQPGATTRPRGSMAPRAGGLGRGGCRGLEQLLPLLRRELKRRGAVAVHGNRHTDFVAAVCAAHLHETREARCRGGAARGGWRRA